MVSERVVLNSKKILRHTRIHTNSYQCTPFDAVFHRLKRFTQKTKQNGSNTLEFQYEKKTFSRFPKYSLILYKKRRERFINIG